MSRSSSRKAARVIVIGAGAAGLMAAGEAAAAGARTLLLEAMDRPGRKLLITGKGRCNLTNIASLSDFVGHFGPQGRFLRQAFARFFSDDLITFLNDRGVPTVTERGGRVFPASESAADVVRALVASARGRGVVVRARTRVEALEFEAGRVTGVCARADEIIPGDAVIVATGGASYPGTGSMGDGYRLAAQAGHTIVPIRPALVGLDTSGATAARLQGLSLRNAAVRLLVDGRRRAEEFGEMLFTHFGVSGPAVLTLSGRAVDALRERKAVALSIDLKPALDEATLDARLVRELEEHSRRRFSACLAELLPRKLIPVCSDLVAIPLDRACHQVTAAERRTLRAWLKDFRLDVTGHRPLAEAIITAGGVELSEIDPRTLSSRLVRGLYFCGEVLDLDADTGGYNLQAAFSTGWLAGRSAAACGE